MTGQLTIDGTEGEPAAPREGFCACLCGEPVKDRKFVNGAHRQRAYRARVKAEMERVGRLLDGETWDEMPTTKAA
jgi:hypothetical protein